MSDSNELRTIKKCSQRLETALMGLDTKLVYFLFEQGFITDAVRITISNPASLLTETNKASELVKWIRNRVELSNKSYWVLLNKFKEHGIRYEPIVDILCKEYASGEPPSGSLQNEERTPSGDLGRASDNKKFPSQVSTEVQVFSTTMTTDKLCSWLLFNQLPESDCQIILGKSIGGRAFKLLTEEKWSSYGISDVGLIVLRDIMGEITGPPGRDDQRTGTVEECAPSLPASALPASARPYLELQLDRGNKGVDRDLIEIARHMLGWEEKLCPHLGLTDVDVYDIKEKYKEKPELQRREALRIWKNNQALRATYGNLLELFERAPHAQCAEAIREIIRKKCENQTTKYPL